MRSCLPLRVRFVLELLHTAVHVGEEVVAENLHATTFRGYLFLPLLLFLLRHLGSEVRQLQGHAELGARGRVRGLALHEAADGGVEGRDAGGEVVGGGGGIHYGLVVVLFLFLPGMFQEFLLWRGER